MRKTVISCEECRFEIEFDREGPNVIYEFDHPQWRKLCVSSEAVSPGSCRFILPLIRKATQSSGSGDPL